MSKNELIQQYQRINRYLTLSVVGILILISLAMWLAGVNLEGRSSLLVGSSLMVGAIAVFQLPRIAYGIWKRLYFQQLVEHPLLAASWSDFRAEVNRQQI